MCFNNLTRLLHKKVYFVNNISHILPNRSLDEEETLDNAGIVCGLMKKRILYYKYLWF